MDDQQINSTVNDQNPVSDTPSVPSAGEGISQPATPATNDGQTPTVEPEAPTEKVNIPVDEVSHAEPETPAASETPATETEVTPEA